MELDNIGGGINSEWVHRAKIGIQKYKKLFIMFQKVARAHRKFVLIYFCGLFISSLWFRPSLPLLVLLSSFKAWSEFISIHVFVCLFASLSLFCLRLAVLWKQRPFCWMYHCTSCIEQCLALFVYYSWTVFILCTLMCIIYLLIRFLIKIN